jgi:hypothetical protein
MARPRSMHGCIVKARLVDENFGMEFENENERFSPRSGFQHVMRRVRSPATNTSPSGMQTSQWAFGALLIEV